MDDNKQRYNTINMYRNTGSTNGKNYSEYGPNTKTFKSQKSQHKVPQSLLSQMTLQPATNYVPPPPKPQQSQTVSPPPQPPKPQQSQTVSPPPPPQPPKPQQSQTVS